MKRTTLLISKMDCPSEERLVRMRLEPLAEVRSVEFDLPRRRLTVSHQSDPSVIIRSLEPLQLGASIIESVDALEGDIPSERPEAERSTLRLLLAINAGMFVIEMTIGWIAGSTGLISDSLDMFADATVYSLGLFAAGRPKWHQNRAARISGYFQMILALGALFEVGRRYFLGGTPEGPLMMGMAVGALIANGACVWLLYKHRHGGSHMRASWIFSTNDALANLGVIVAGALVMWTKSRIPDLMIGTLIAAWVLRGAVKILRLSSPSDELKGISP